MVGIQRDGFLVARGDADGKNLAVVVLQMYALSDCQILGSGELINLEGYDGFRVVFAVGFGGKQMDICRLARFHIGYCLVESVDHHAGSADEFQRFASVIRGIKGGSVIEGAAIVHTNGFADIFSVKVRCVIMMAATATAATAAATAAAASFF